jgi:hypothetical protein
MQDPPRHLPQAPSLKVSTGWIELIVTGEPFVVPTWKGYAPVLPVKTKINGLDYILYISAKSFADGIEPLRQKNGGRFQGLSISVRKASADKFSLYEIKEDPNGSQP